MSAVHVGSACLDLVFDLWLVEDAKTIKLFISKTMLYSNMESEVDSDKVPKLILLLNLLIAPMSLMIFFAASVELTIGNMPNMGIPLFINFVKCSQWIL